METKTKKRKPQTHADVDVESLIVIQRVFEAPARTVWLYLTEAEYFKKWYGPEGYACPYSKMESRVGGKYLNCMQAPDGKKFWGTGIVKEFVPEKKLVITDNFADEKGNIVPPSEYGMKGDWPDNVLITYELEEADGATKLRLTHEGVPPEMHDDCVQGWNECFDKLERSIEK